MTDKDDSNKRTRGHWFVINNPTEEDKAQVLSLRDRAHFKYLVFQLEEGDEEKTPHFQGYVQYDQPLRRKYTTDVLKRACVKPADGSPASNKRYCTKNTGRLDGPWEFGESPSQGKRTDLESASEIIRTGGTLKQVAESNPSTFIKYYKGLEVYKETISPTKPRDFLTELWVFYGEPGTGKSWSAHEIAKNDLYPLSPANSGAWWDGYTGQHYVLIDEFKSNLPLGTLKRLADRYPLSVDRKGHTGVQFVSRTLIITTNLHPDDWYSGDKITDTERAALKRRFTYLVRFSRGSLPVIEYDVRENKTDLPICPFV